jgi:hypothetical protein
MKIPPLPEILRGGHIGPLAPVLQPAAHEPTRVHAVRAGIAAGRYTPDCRKVADGVLSAIAATRRH